MSAALSPTQPHLSRGILRTRRHSPPCSLGKRWGRNLSLWQTAWRNHQCLQNGLGVSHSFYQAWCSRGKDVKSSFAAGRWSQLCGPAFKVAQHFSSSCSIGKVPQNPVIPLNTLLEKMHLGTKSSQEALILFQSITPWEMLPHSQGSPGQTAPLSRTSHPSSTVTAALGPLS